MKKNYYDYFYFFIGLFGACLTLLGLWYVPAQVYFIVGSSLLLATAVYFKLLYFIALEIILIAGHGVILLGIGPALQLALPILLCFQLLFFYFLIGKLNNIFLIIGIIGIATISVGFSYEDQWIFFIGSTAVAIYAFFFSTRNLVSLLWAVLNTLFALIAVVKIGLAHFS